MDVVILIARLLLAAVFLVAGAAKLADLRDSRQAMANFGLPPALAAPLGTLLPPAELIVGLLLLPAATAWAGGILALLLLALFLAGIAFNLWRGRRPDCQCFGRLHSEPVGRVTLLRNGLLAAVTLPILARPSDQPSFIHELGRLSATEAALVVVAALILVEGWFLLRLLQMNGRLLLRVEALEARPISDPVPATSSRVAGLPIGSPAPEFALPALDGGTTSLDNLRAAGKPVMLIFSNPDCHACAELMPELGRWQREQPALTIAVVSRGSLEGNQDKVEQHGLSHVLLQRDKEIEAAYRVPATPVGVLILPNGVIGSRLLLGADEIRPLVLGVSDTSHPVSSTGGNGHRQLS